MFKYVTIFVCLLGVSLGSRLSGLSAYKEAEVLELLEAVKEHREYFDLCEDVLGEKVKSCDTLMTDLETTESDVKSAVSAALGIYGDAMTIMTEFNSCATKSILKQITCYEKCITSAKALLATAEEELATYQEELATDVSTIESDVESCVYAGYTKQLLNTKISLCKQSLMHKN